VLIIGDNKALVIFPELRLIGKHHIDLQNTRFEEYQRPYMNNNRDQYHFSLQSTNYKKQIQEMEGNTKEQVVAILKRCQLYS